MKITKQRLKEMIKEELSAILFESGAEINAALGVEKYGPINLRLPRTVIDRVNVLLAAGEITSENGGIIDGQLNNKLQQTTTAAEKAELKALKQKLLKIGATTLGAAAAADVRSTWHQGVTAGTHSLSDLPPGI